jgi:hypothetical protein
LVENSGFSLSTRAKQLKIAKITIHRVISNYCASESIEKNKGSGKKVLRKPKISEEHQPCFAGKFKPQL